AFRRQILSLVRLPITPLPHRMLLWTAKVWLILQNDNNFLFFALAWLTRPSVNHGHHSPVHMPYMTNHSYGRTRKSAHTYPDWPSYPQLTPPGFSKPG